MKKPILLFIFFMAGLILANTSSAQVVPCNPIQHHYQGIQNGAEIPQQCDCVRFKHACTGLPAPMPGGQVSMNCSSGTPHPDICWNIDSPYDGQCSFGTCESYHRMSLIFKNWTICGSSTQNPCDSLYVTQFLPYNPYLNGQLLGNWPLVPSNPPPLNLNNIHSRTVLETCPGDQAILTIPDLFVPQASGLCLHVNIRDESGTIVAQDIFDPSDIAGETVDLTNLFATLGADIYQLEFILRCCDPQAAHCVYTNSNTFTKRVWIEVAGEYSFATNLSQGGGFSGCPLNSQPLSPNPLGPVYEDVGTCGGINLSFYNIINPESNDLEITIYELLNCDIQSELLVGTVTEPLQDGGNFVITVPPIPPDEDCRCYRIDLEYETCGTIKMESYYYQVDGSNNECEHELEEFGGIQSKKSGEFDDAIHARVFPNPTSGDIQIEIQSNDDGIDKNWELSIFDNSGKLVHSSTVQISGNSSEKISLEVPPGIYFYYLHQQDHSFNGRFIKN